MWCGPAIAGAYMRLCSDVPSSRSTSHMPDSSCMHCSYAVTLQGTKTKPLHELGLSPTTFRPHLGSCAFYQDIQISSNLLWLQ